MSYPQHIYDIATRLLQAVEAGFADAGIPLPSQRIVYGGTIPVDDFTDPDAVIPGLVAVGLVQIVAGQPGRATATEQIPPAITRSVTLQVEIHRPSTGLTQQVQVPTETEMTTDAQTFMADATFLLAALEDARAEYTVVVQRTPFSIGPIRPIPVVGDSGGTRAQVTVSLE